MASTLWRSITKQATTALVGATTLYFAILGLVVLFPTLQTHVFYLHRVSLTWFKDLNCPEQFGFLHNQVTPFYISTSDGEKLHAWHILPLGVYVRNEEALLRLKSSPTQRKTGNAVAATPDNGLMSQLQIQLLRDDPQARLVLYFHGTAGCLASGWRPDSYRALYSAAPDHIHVLTFDYRGYGLSSGTPSEEGLLKDALAVVDWAINTVGIPQSRIVIYGQSLGTAVAISMLTHLATMPNQPLPVSFAGVVLTATFSDVATLSATYRIGGIIPVLSPLSYAPPLLDFFRSFLTSTWMSKARIADYVRAREQDIASRSEDLATNYPYHVTFIHAEDDSDIACQHSHVVYWHAVNSASAVDDDSTGISYEQLEEEKRTNKVDLGQGGWFFDYRSDSGGLLRLQILKYGVHDKLMSYPSTAVAVLRTFQAADSGFGR